MKEFHRTTTACAEISLTLLKKHESATTISKETHGKISVMSQKENNLNNHTKNEVPASLADTIFVCFSKNKGIFL